MKRRKRKRGKRRHLPWQLMLLGLALLLVSPWIGINLAVRHLGRSATHPLAVDHMEDKARALGLLALHHLRGGYWRQPQDLREMIRTTAAAHSVPESFALAIARVETGMMPYRISPAGAMGLMQLMPDTAAGLGVQDPFDARQNAAGSMTFIRWLWHRYQGDRARVAAAYNAGPGRIPRRGPLEVRRLPGETREYVRRVLALCPAPAPGPEAAPARIEARQGVDRPAGGDSAPRPAARRSTQVASEDSSARNEGARRLAARKPTPVAAKDRGDRNARQPTPVAAKDRGDRNARKPTPVAVKDRGDRHEGERRPSARKPTPVAARPAPAASRKPPSPRGRSPG